MSAESFSLQSGNTKGMKHTRVVEFTGLANCQTTTANDNDLLDIDLLVRLNYTAINVRLGVRRRLGGSGGI
jgi:hypothetical protein